MGLRFLDLPRALLPAAILVYLAFVWISLEALPTKAQPSSPSNIPGCVYLSSPGTLAPNQTAPCTMTNDRRLRVDTTGSTPSGTQTVVGAVTAADGAALTNTLVTYSYGGLYNGTTMDLWREIVTGSNTTGGGVAGVGVMAQCDDTTPQLITENRFGNLRFNCVTHDLIVGGSAADDAAAGTTYPVPVGGIYNSTKPTYTNLDRTQLQSDVKGNTLVNGGVPDNTTTASIGTGALPVAILDNSGGTYRNLRQIANATDSTGTGIAAAGLVAQFDDTSPTSTTENQFGNVRKTATGGLLSGHVLTGGALTENDFACSSFAAISVTAGNTTQIVALSGSTIIRVCTISVSTSLTGTWTILSGTGSNCGTPANSTGAMPIVTGSQVTIGGTGDSAVYRGSAGGELCVAAATGNITGWVMYAQH